MNSELRKLIETASLEDQEKKVLVELFENADEELAGIAIDLFRRRPEWVGRFVKNMTAKKYAAAHNDVAMWNKILEAEMAVLQSPDLFE